jgi:hypothetical protein
MGSDIQEAAGKGFGDVRWSMILGQDSAFRDEIHSQKRCWSVHHNEFGEIQNSGTETRIRITSTINLPLVLLTYLLHSTRA